MAQHDYIIANQSGAAFRSDLNNGLAAIVSQNSGAAQPSTTYAYQWWADTTTGLLKIRNAANNAWITLFQLDGEWTTLALENGTAAAPSLYFKDSGTDTGLFSPGADQLAVATGGVERVEFGTTEVVFNDDGADVDFRVEGDINANLFKIDAGLDQVQVANLNGGPLAGFRNRIINGNFDIWQRGTSFTGNELGADRWVHGRVGTTHTASRVAFTVGQTAVPNEPTYLCRTVVTSVAGAGNYAILEQRIEDVRTFAGQQVTISFWAKADATKNIAINMVQNFGTGGSPSANAGISGTKVSIGTTFQKVTVTATLPSISGKTFGTDANNHLKLFIWFDAGSTYNSDTDSLGQQSGTFDIAQVQIEPGPVATPFEQRPIGTELALCQRYYEKSYELGTTPGGAATAGSHWFTSLGSTANVLSSVLFSVKKRTSPTVSIWDTAGNANKASSGDASLVISTNNTQSSIVQYAGDSGIVFRQSDPISGAVTVGYQWVASSEL
jgi:hypothetical protein